MSLIYFRRMMTLRLVKPFLKNLLAVFVPDLGAAGFRVFSADTVANTTTLDTGTGLSPTAGVSSAMFSRDGKYLVMGVSDTSRLQFWRRDGDTFTRIPITNVADISKTIPTGLAQYGVSITPDGQYAFAVSTSEQGIFYVFKRSDDMQSYAFQLRYGGSGGVSPNNTGGLVSPDGLHYLIANLLYSSISIYKRDTETSFSGITGISKPDANGWQPKQMVFSPDGKFLFVVAASATYALVVYRRDGDTYTRVASAVPYSGSTGLTISPDGTHVAVTSEGSVYLTIYRWDAAALTLTKLTVPALGKNAYSVSYSKDGSTLAVGYADAANSNKVAFYKRAGDSYTKLTTAAIADSTTKNPFVVFSPA